MSPREKSAVVDELFADFVGRLQAQAPASVSRTAQIIPFPRRETLTEARATEILFPSGMDDQTRARLDHLFREAAMAIADLPKKRD